MVVGLDVTGGDDAELLVGFVVLAFFHPVVVVVVRSLERGLGA